MIAGKMNAAQSTTIQSQSGIRWNSSRPKRPSRSVRAGPSSVMTAMFDSPDLSCRIGQHAFGAALLEIEREISLPDADVEHALARQIGCHAQQAKPPVKSPLDPGRPGENAVAEIERGVKMGAKLVKPVA